MSEPYPIVDVTAWPREYDETLGTKEKFWVRGPDAKRWLFKFSYRVSQDGKTRTVVGDDWAEQIASEIAEVLGLPHATVEMAQHAGLPGIISLDFTDSTKRGELILGNSLLLELDPDYPTEEKYRVPQHTVARVAKALSLNVIQLPIAYSSTEVIRRPMDLFAGYLLLDALISNQDRHHENWGVLLQRSTTDQRVELAPTFDHASSLGGILLDDERQRRLSTNDKGFTVAAFVQKARSAFFSEGNVKNQLTTLNAFAQTSAFCPQATGYWRQKAAVLDDLAIRAIVERVPASRMGNFSKQFAVEMIRCNREAILEHG